MNLHLGTRTAMTKRRGPKELADMAVRAPACSYGNFDFRIKQDGATPALSKRGSDFGAWVQISSSAANPATRVRAPSVKIIGYSSS